MVNFILYFSLKIASIASDMSLHMNSSDILRDATDFRPLLFLAIGISNCPLVFLNITLNINVIQRYGMLYEAARELTIY